jgi:hypothetical protein
MKPMVFTAALIALLSTFGQPRLSGAQSSGIACDCRKTGEYKAPVPGVAPINPDGTSPSGIYRVTSTVAGPIVNVTVRRVADGRVVLPVAPQVPAFWSFSPDDHRFVYHNVTNGIHNVFLYDLEGGQARLVKDYHSAAGSAPMGGQSRSNPGHRTS